MSLTIDRQLETISRRSGREGRFEAITRQERLVDVAHYVHLNVFVELRLSPEDRVIEETVLIGVEFAFEDDGVSWIDDVHLVDG